MKVARSVVSSVLWVGVLSLIACSDFGPPPPTVVNECSSDEACVSGSCDSEAAMCVTESFESFEIAITVLPPEEIGTLAAWTTDTIEVNGPLNKNLRLPPHVEVVGTLRWGERRVPADIVLSRPGLDGRPIDKVRVSTFREATPIGEMHADFLARVESGGTYDVDVFPSAENVPDSEVPWLRTLPPMRLEQITTPTADEMTTNVVWPVEIEFPPFDATCGDESFAGCVLSGEVVDAEEMPEEGLQIRAIEVETGRVVSSTGLTDADGAFRIITSPDAAPYVLRVTGGERDLFPTVTVDPALLPAGEARIRVPDPETVVYRGTVESVAGEALPTTTLAFSSTDVLDDTMLRGSYRATVETGPRGDFEIELLAGTYEVVVSPTSREYAVVSEDLRIQPTPTGDPLMGQLFVAPARASFGGTVRTSDLESVPSVAIEAVALGLPGGEEIPAAALYNRSSDASTDETGLFELRLDLGTYDVFVKPPAESRYGWIALTDQVIGSLDATLSTPFELTAPVPIRGVVERADGTPLMGAEVRVFGRRMGSERFVEIGRGQSDDIGGYQVLISPRIPTATSL